MTDQPATPVDEGPEELENDDSLVVEPDLPDDTNTDDLDPADIPDVEDDDEAPIGEGVLGEGD